MLVYMTAFWDDLKSGARLFEDRPRPKTADSEQRPALSPRGIHTEPKASSNAPEACPTNSGISRATRDVCMKRVGFCLPPQGFNALRTCRRRRSCRSFAHPRKTPRSIADIGPFRSYHPGTTSSNPVVHTLLKMDASVGTARRDTTRNRCIRATSQARLC